MSYRAVTYALGEIVGNCRSVLAAAPSLAKCDGTDFVSSACDLCCPSRSFDDQYYAEKIGIASLHYKIERDIAFLGKVILPSSSGDANGLITFAYDMGASDPVLASGSWAFRLAQAMHNFGVLFPRGAWTAGRVELVREFTFSTLRCGYKSYGHTEGSYGWPSSKRTAEQSEILKRILPRGSLVGGSLPSDDYLKKWRAEVVVPLVMEFAPMRKRRYIPGEISPITVAHFEMSATGDVVPRPWMAKFLELFAPINISGAVKAYAKAKQAGAHIGTKATGSTVAKTAGSTVAKAASSAVAEPKSDSKTSKAGIVTVGILAAVAVAVAAFSFKGQV